MGRTRSQNRADDPTPITGGGRISSRLLRPVPADNAVPADALDKHLVRLLALHPDVASKFPDVDLATMDDDARRALLGNINRLLGIDERGTR